MPAAQPLKIEQAIAGAVDREFLKSQVDWLLSRCFVYAQLLADRDKEIAALKEAAVAKESVN